MPIRRCSDQNRCSLREFYLEFKISKDMQSQKLGEAMLEWIDAIDKEFKEIQIWGLTSITHLVLLSKDDWQSRWHVRLISNGDEYIIEYLMPNDLAPSPRAYVKGKCNSLEEGMGMVKVAIERSKGWEMK